MTLAEWQDNHKGANPIRQIKIKAPDGRSGWLVDVFPRGKTNDHWSVWIGAKDYDVKKGGAIIPIPLKTPSEILNWEVLAL